MHCNGIRDGMMMVVAAIRMTGWAGGLLLAAAGITAEPVLALTRIAVPAAAVAASDAAPAAPARTNSKWESAAAVAGSVVFSLMLLRRRQD